MKDLPIRTLVAMVLLAMLALVIWLGGWLQAAVVGLFAVLGVFEMNSVFKQKNYDPFIAPAVVLGASMLAILYRFGTVYMVSAFYCAFIAIVFERIVNKKRTNADTLASVFILIYPLAFLSCFGLIGFDRFDTSRLAFLCIFAGVAMADNTAYLLGSLIGKHKLCPSISPKKSVEGAIGGLIGGALGGVAAYFIQKAWGFDFSMLSLVAVCFFAGLIGQFGDLFASTFKRWAGIKDFGKIFPGHGGIIDRLDSAMLAAPFVVLAFRFFFNK